MMKTRLIVFLSGISLCLIFAASCGTNKESINPTPEIEEVEDEVNADDPEMDNEETAEFTPDPELYESEEDTATFADSYDHEDTDWE